MNTFPRIATAGLALATLFTAGCTAISDSMWGMLGWEKRDLFVESVEDAREEQADAKETFKSTFDTFKELTAFEGGELESIYKKLQGQYDDCVDAADDVGKRIARIEDVSGDLFAEWESEIQEFSDPAMRQRSEQQKRETERKCNDMVAAMRKAEASMQPVLTKFKDHVLSLKHQLNAQAVNSLQGELTAIETSVGNLIDDMQKSIDEADAFLKQIEG